MLSFWIIVALICLTAIIAIWLGLSASRRNNQTRLIASTALRDAQLDEVSASLQSGQIAQAEADAMIAEIKRAFSRATRRGEDAEASDGPKFISWALILGCIGASVWIYSWIGIPGLEDFGAEKRAQLERPNQETIIDLIAERGLAREVPPMDKDTQFLLTKLKDAIDKNPEIAEGYKHLRTINKQTGNIIAAYQAQQKYIELMGEKATSEDYALLAEDMILSAHGYVSPEAESALRMSLKLDPQNNIAIFYSALTMKQEGSLDQARDVLVQLKARDLGNPEWYAEIERQIAQIDEQNARIKGPSNADIEAANAMTPEERQEMIGAMVDGLKSRLAQEGGQPEEWARLINALRVLERNEEADRILSEALSKFPAAPEIQAIK